MITKGRLAGLYREEWCGIVVTPTDVETERSSFKRRVSLASLEKSR